MIMFEFTIARALHAGTLRRLHSLQAHTHTHLLPQWRLASCLWRLHLIASMSMMGSLHHGRLCLRLWVFPAAHGVLPNDDLLMHYARCCSWPYSWRILLLFNNLSWGYTHFKQWYSYVHWNTYINCIIDASTFVSYIRVYIKHFLFCRALHQVLHLLLLQWVLANLCYALPSVGSHAWPCGFSIVYPWKLVTSCSNHTLAVSVAACVCVPLWWYGVHTISGTVAA